MIVFIRILGLADLSTSGRRVRCFKCVHCVCLVLFESLSKSGNRKCLPSQLSCQRI